MVQCCIIHVHLLPERAPTVSGVLSSRSILSLPCTPRQSKFNTSWFKTLVLTKTTENNKNLSAPLSGLRSDYSPPATHKKTPQLVTHTQTLSDSTCGTASPRRLLRLHIQYIVLL